MSKKFKVKIQDIAIDELDHLYQRIAQDKPSAAKKWIKGLQEKILALSTFPHRGSLCQLPKRSKRLPEIRFISYQHYLIFYQISEQEVTVLHLSGPGKDWLSLFL